MAFNQQRANQGKTKLRFYHDVVPFSGDKCQLAALPSIIAPKPSYSTSCSQKLLIHHPFPVVFRLSCPKNFLINITDKRPLIAKQAVAAQLPAVVSLCWIVLNIPWRMRIQIFETTPDPETLHRDIPSHLTSKTISTNDRKRGNNLKSYIDICEPFVIFRQTGYQHRGELFMNISDKIWVVLQSLRIVLGKTILVRLIPC